MNSLITATGRLVRIVAPGFIGVAFIRLGLSDAQVAAAWPAGYGWALVAAACLGGLVLNRIHTALLGDLFGWLATGVSRRFAPHARTFADAAALSTYELMLRMERRRFARRTSADRVQRAFQRKHDDLGDSVTFFCCSAYPGLIVLALQLVLGRAHCHFQAVAITTLSLLFLGVLGALLYARRDVWAYEALAAAESSGAGRTNSNPPATAEAKSRPAASVEPLTAKKMFHKQLKAWILEMFYPAVLGAVFYTFLPFVREYERIPDNLPAFVISLLLVVHFCTDYLYTKLLDDYSLVVFVTDMIVMFCLYFAFDSVNYVDHRGITHFDRAAYAMGIIYVMFILSDVVLRREAKGWTPLILFEVTMSAFFLTIGAAHLPGAVLTLAVALATSGLLWFTVKTFPAKPGGD